MTELAADGNIAEIDDAEGEEAIRIGDYLASHGGPFFELQRRLGMLREDALLAGRRAALFVALAWGVPFLLSLVGGSAFSLADGRAYLVDFCAWARFFIAIGLFMLSEQQIEYGLNGKLGQLVRAPIIAPDCFAAAASAVVRALRLRDSRAAEIICLGLAIVGTVVWLTFGYIITAWLAIVFAFFAFPLLAFSRPLAELKDRSAEVLGAQATRYHRAAERALIGRNLAANDSVEATAPAVPDPSAQFAASRKLSIFLMSRSAVAPLAFAALAPFAIAGATKLPYKEVFAMIKKLLVL